VNVLKRTEMRAFYGGIVAFSGRALAYDCQVTQRVGCFLDGGDSPTSTSGPAILAFEAASADGQMTKERCASLCRDHGFGDDALAGVEYGKQCFCGNGYTVMSPTTKDDSECNRPCSGDASQTSGGTYAIEVFKASCSGNPGPSPYCHGDFAWCDHTMSLDDRVDAIVANLTAEEKSALFRNQVGSIDRIGWPRYNWWSEALHGVARDGLGTSFPQIIGVASSLNRTLWHQLGQLTSTEGRGKNNGLRGSIYQGLTFWAPNVNIFRDPRWGRGQETPGEDPKINGDYAVAYVTGLQGDDATYLKTSACLKHYAAYSEEQGRNSFAAVVTKQDMEDTYLPAFEAGVTRGGASSIMCSYNAETYGYGIYGNGTQEGAIPSCANKGILNDLARDKWGFDGYITSDCGAVGNVQNQHHYTRTADETARATLTAGMDTDCGGFLTEKVMMPLINDKSSGGSDLVDTALKNLFRVQFRLGFADPPALVPWSAYGTDQVDTQPHRELAREAADQSLVLLKNDGSLPFGHELGAPSGTEFSMLVAGRNAKATGNMQGNYFGDAPFLRSPVDGLSKYGSIIFHDGKDVAAVVQDVAGVNAVVLVVGLTSEAVPNHDEAEGQDRSSLRLPSTDGDQEALIEQVGAAAGGKPVILVVMGGGPVDISAAKENPAISAIIWCGYPGQSGGDAIADAIFGITNRFGKLTQTWYPESFVSQVGLTDMGMRPNAETGNPGRSYRFYTGPTVFSFGDGLSYTTFEHSVTMTHLLTAADVDEDLSRKPLQKDARVVSRAQVGVTNTGGRDGDAVVMLFVSPPADLQSKGAPSKSLVGFDRISLASGDSHTLSFDLTSLDLSFAGEDGERLSAEGDWRVFVGGEESISGSGLVNLRHRAAVTAFV